LIKSDRAPIEIADSGSARKQVARELPKSTFEVVRIIAALDAHLFDYVSVKIVDQLLAGLQAKTAHWLTALDMAVQRQFPQGSRDHGLQLTSDNGCQPTSVVF